MKKKLFIFFTIILLSLSQGAFSLYSQHTITLKSSLFNFKLSYPYDWQCENDPSLPSNIQAVLIPQAFLMDESPATIYVRVVPRPPLLSSLKDFMKTDFEQVKKNRPHIQYGTDFTLTTTDHKKAQIKTYFEEPQGLYDAISYIPEKNAFVIIILQATSQKAYLKALPTFRNLIISYQVESSSKEAAKAPLKKKEIIPKKKKPKRKKVPKKQSQSLKC